MGGGLLHSPRIFTVTDLTTTIYSLVYGGTTASSPGIINHTL